MRIKETITNFKSSQFLKKFSLSVPRKCIEIIREKIYTNDKVSTDTHTDSRLFINT